RGVERKLDAPQFRQPRVQLAGLDQPVERGGQAVEVAAVVEDADRGGGTHVLLPIYRPATEPVDHRYQDRVANHSVQGLADPLADHTALIPQPLGVFTPRYRAAVILSSVGGLASPSIRSTSCQSMTWLVIGHPAAARR